MISCLCVTEDRPEFMPWLLWNYDKQLGAEEKELVIIDSSSVPYQSDRADVRVITTEPGTAVWEKRNVALTFAQGEYITWFDDDDWQSPNKLSFLSTFMPEQDCVTSADSAFIDLHTFFWREHVKVRPIFNSGMYRKDAVSKFPKLPQSSDGPWMARLAKTRRCLTFEGIYLSMWLCHDKNLSNPRYRLSHKFFPNQLASLRRVLGAHWEDTGEQLFALRERVSP